MEVQTKNSADRKSIQAWYWSGATLVFIILIIGGITRLTGSGLSMTDWEPIMGAIPPLSEADWNEAFDQYKLYPEYYQVNSDMTLGEFKVIFFWEYLHRMLGRLLGLVFLIPFGWFLIRKKLDRKQTSRALVLLGIGTLQGLMGWYMVQSGLVDVPAVSHYRLAAHLFIAFVIFGLCVWFALDLSESRNAALKDTGRLFGWGVLLLVLISLQVVYGAFTAGLHAGHVYNTFPTMFGYWMPPELWISEPLWMNFLQNMVTVQWMHRVIGTLIGLVSIWMLVRAFIVKAGTRVMFHTLAVTAAVLFQYLIGVYTLIYHVPVWLGVFHQGAALLLVGVVVSYIHLLGRGKAQILTD
ncbi:COX15/CtaA family protein [Rhodohalobacter mucosus]|uniref:Heme A synthase n=1 Tax=Rhodohalobacter mucosus TaxID=2079485 RepID=A0A316TYS7_9BACT|nr:COX15/CtaA family protein [Rhodohalobacter mucosus]PWN07984.1 heme A synthase [Rhodohalobacter mucosus]